MRNYIIPMAQHDIDLREWLPRLSQYGVGVLDIVASVFRAAMVDDKRYHLDVANYIKRVIEQQYYELRLHSDGQPSVGAISDEIDTATIAAIEMCDVVYEHIRVYLADIEARESALIGDDGCYYLHLVGMIGDDIIIASTDEPDERCV